MRSRGTKKLQIVGIVRSRYVTLCPLCCPIVNEKLLYPSLSPTDTPAQWGIPFHLYIFISIVCLLCNETSAMCLTTQASANVNVVNRGQCRRRRLLSSFQQVDAAESEASAKARFGHSFTSFIWSATFRACRGPILEICLIFANICKVGRRSE